MPDRGAAANVTALPYLSVVVTARNDDHGGNLRARMQAFVNGLLAQCERHRVPAELIVVEWNPVPGRPGLAEALDWTAGDGSCQVRIIEVPAALHRRFARWQALPLYQMIAKNVGIRRARGEFILATNIDILFSDELFEMIGARRLQTGKMYRVDRWDVMADVPADRSISEQLAWCGAHLLRVNRRDGTFALDPDGSMKIHDSDIVARDGPLVVGENWFPREVSGSEPFRWMENDAELIIAEPGDVILSLDIECGPGVSEQPCLLEVRTSAGELMASGMVERRGVVRLPLRTLLPKTSVFLHTDYGGVPIASDLRTLNFRVFRCEIGRAAPGDALRPASAPVRASGGMAGRFVRAARVLLAALFSTSEIRIPMSREGLRRLKLRQDESAVMFNLGPLLGKKPSGDALLARGLAALWEEGWYDIEYFRGECFRWMQHEASMTLVLPAGGSSSVALRVEPGPAVAFRRARVEIRDFEGTLLAAGDIHGRTRLELPLHGEKGMLPLRFVVTGGEARPAPGDSRTMAMRLFGCEVSPPAQREVELTRTHFFEAVRGSGIWCIRGFRLRPEGLLAAQAAEMSVRNADRVTLEVAASPSRLTIRDHAGSILFNGPVSGGEAVTVAGESRNGHLYLHFDCDPPVIFRSIRRSRGSETSAAFLPGSSRQSPARLHTNGCGDFTMMARQHWFDLRGYPEFDAFSMNMDSALCWAAHHGGAREEVLRDPVRIYHLEHATGSGWTPEGEQKLYQRILEKGLPWIDYRDVLTWARTMHRFDVPIIFNGPQWGMVDEALQEVTPRRKACGAMKT